MHGITCIVQVFSTLLALVFLLKLQWTGREGDKYGHNFEIMNLLCTCAKGRLLGLHGIPRIHHP